MTTEAWFLVGFMCGNLSAVASLIWIQRGRPRGVVLPSTWSAATNLDFEFDDPDCTCGQPSGHGGECR